MSQQTDRNYDNTGADTRGGSTADVWLQVNAKEATITREKGAKRLENFAGFLESVDIRHEKGNQEKKIKPAWKLTLFLTAREGDGIKKFGVDFSGNLVIYTPEIINALLGTDPLSWDGYLYFSTYMKADKPRIYVKTDPNEKFYKGALAWNKDTDRYEGAPERPVIGTDEDGNAMRNNKAHRLFWYDMACKLYAKINGKSFDPPQELTDYLNTQREGAPATAPQQPAVVPPPPPAAPTAADKIEKYKNVIATAVIKCVNADQFLDKATKAIAHGHQIGIFTPNFTTDMALVLFTDAYRVKFGGEGYFAMDINEIPSVVKFYDSLPF